MKKLLTLLLALVAVLGVSAQIVTPQPSPFSKVEQRVGLTDITLEYSRPSMRGRTIVGGLEPYGEIWRTGANARTKITFSTDVMVNGQTLKAGSYAILTKPGAENWDVYFYTEYDGNGATIEWDDDKVATKINIDVYPLPMDIETFTMTFDDLTNSSVNLGIMWENVYIGVPIKLPTDNMVLASINNAMNGTPTASDYFNAAVYYLQENKNIERAKEWIDKAISMSGNNLQYWQLRQQSLIYAKAGDKAGAIAIAKKGLVAAEAAGNPDYVKLNKDSLKEWGAM